MAEPWSDAFAMIQQVLGEWGLLELSSTVWDMLEQGTTPEVVPLRLRDTEPYKERFKANQQRIANGLSALSEAEFLAMEGSLKTIVRRYVGSGTYDTKDSIDRLIAGDLSPQELEERMSQYREMWLERSEVPVELDDGSTSTVGELWARAGLTPAQGIATFMDPEVTDQELERQAKTYALGAASVQAFRDARSLDIGRLTSYVQRGADPDRAQQQYADIARRYDYEGFIARRGGEELTLAEQEEAELVDDTEAQQERERLLRAERARFTGQSYLGEGRQFTRETRGQY